MEINKSVKMRLLITCKPKQVLFDFKSARYDLTYHGFSELFFVFRRKCRCVYCSLDLASSGSDLSGVWPSLPLVIVLSRAVERMVWDRVFSVF